MRSQAHGVVRLTSKDPREHPLMDPKYLSAEQDLIEFRRCIELSRDLFAQKSFDLYRGEEMAPGANCKTDEDVIFLRILKH
jgi:choline dehydrogenase